MKILDYLWGTDYAAESNVVDRHIRGLRAKLQNDWRRPRYIVTVPGKGYTFTPTSDASTTRELLAGPTLTGVRGRVGRGSDTLHPDEALPQS